MPKHDQRLAAWLAIGSGQVEGDCKNLIGRSGGGTEVEAGPSGSNGDHLLHYYGDQWNDYRKTAH